MATLLFLYASVEFKRTRRHEDKSICFICHHFGIRCMSAVLFDSFFKDLSLNIANWTVDSVVGLLFMIPDLYIASVLRKISLTTSLFNPFIHKFLGRKRPLKKLYYQQKSYFLASILIVWCQKLMQTVWGYIKINWSYHAFGSRKPNILFLRIF